MSRQTHKATAGYTIPTHFYLNDELHKRIKIDRAGNLLYAWSYPQHQIASYILSDARKRIEPAYRMYEVGPMLNRSYKRIVNMIYDGDLKRPDKIYDIKTGEVKQQHPFYCSPKYVLYLHDYFKTKHRGHPRKDGIVIPMAMPSRGELRAMMEHEPLMYIKTSEGEFVPVWKEPDW